MGVAERVRAAAIDLRRQCDDLRFGHPVTHVYDPLGYAAKGHWEYIRRFATGPRRVVFLGMNPGPYGMVQTGVPFGEVQRVRDWLGIDVPIGTPPREHPKRPVLGFACTRSEVSGARLWGAIAEHWKTPERFFANHYIANYCPLVFMEESGRNRTPDKLPAIERRPLYEACDRHLQRLVKALDAEWVIGVGAFATSKAREVLGDRVRIGTVLHPSPASPRANRGWAEQARADLMALDLCS